MADELWGTSNSYVEPARAADAPTVSMPAVTGFPPVPYVPPAPPVLPAPPDPPTVTAPPVGPDTGRRETVTCPECGAVQDILLNRRDSDDFCRACDFPLFWTPAQVQRERDAQSDGESLRRLPGAVGRSTLASATCPHCAELNLVTAQTCIRCGQSMHRVAPPPPPPVYVPPPPPPAPVEVIPEARLPWWVWAIAGFIVVAAVTLGILYITHVIG